jgi:WD40 repeat protein
LPDGREVWSGAHDGVLLVHDVANAASLRNIQAHRAPILHIDLAATGAATASRDRTVKIWNITTGTPLRTLGSPHGGVFAVKCRDGRLALATFDNRVGIADAPAAPLRWLVGHGAVVADVAWADEQHVASASRDQTILLWDLASGHVLRRFVGHSHFVTRITCVANGEHAISAAEDGTIRRWDLRGGTLIWSVAPSEHREPIWGMAVRRTIDRDRQRQRVRSTLRRRIRCSAGDVG